MKLEEPAQENPDTLAIVIPVNNKILYFWLRSLMSLGQHPWHYGKLVCYLQKEDPFEFLTMIVSREKLQVPWKYRNPLLQDCLIIMCAYSHPIAGVLVSYGTKFTYLLQYNVS